MSCSSTYPNKSSIVNYSGALGIGTYRFDYDFLLLLKLDELLFDCISDFLFSLIFDAILLSADFLYFLLSECKTDALSSLFLSSERSLLSDSFPPKVYIFFIFGMKKFSFVAIESVAVDFLVISIFSAVFQNSVFSSIFFSILLFYLH